MNTLRYLAALVAIVAVAGSPACSNDSTKKSSQKDASTADGSSGAGGTSGSGGSAGADAAAGTGGGAGVAGGSGSAGAAGADAGLDAATDGDAATGCGTGTVKNLQTGACVTCVDGGAAGAAGADGGSDPYTPIATCQEFATTTTSFDPSTGLLVIHVDYALQIDSLDYALSAYGSDADGGYFQASPSGTLPLVNNTATLDLSAALGAGFTLQSLSVQRLSFTDACGRVSVFDNQACNADYIQFDQVDGGLWTASCLPC